MMFYFQCPCYSRRPYICRFPHYLTWRHTSWSGNQVGFQGFLAWVISIATSGPESHENNLESSACFNGSPSKCVCEGMIPLLFPAKSADHDCIWVLNQRSNANEHRGEQYTWQNTWIIMNQPIQRISLAFDDAHVRFECECHRLAPPGTPVCTGGAEWRLWMKRMAMEIKCQTPTCLQIPGKEKHSEESIFPRAAFALLERSYDSYTFLGYTDAQHWSWGGSLHLRPVETALAPLTGCDSPGATATWATCFRDGGFVQLRRRGRGDALQGASNNSPEKMLGLEGAVAWPLMRLWLASTISCGFCSTGTGKKLVAMDQKLPTKLALQAWHMP